MAHVLEKEATQADNIGAGIPGLPRDLASNALPEAFAPLIRNTWYVVAESKDVDRTLKRVTALNEPLVLYRTEAGEAVVLDDRRAPQDLRSTHQFFQVSLSFKPKGGIAAFRDILVQNVFQQDVDAIEAMNAVISDDNRTGRTEYGIPGRRSA